MKSRILLTALLLSLSVGSMIANSQHFTPVGDTGLPYAIVVDSVIHETILTPGVDEIAVFDGDLCVGMSYYSDENFSVTAWEGDPGFGFLGFEAGNPILFRIYVSMDNREYYGDPEFTEGDGTFGMGPYTAVLLESGDVNSIEERESLQPDQFRIVSIYPNPFNNITTLSLFTSKARTVEIGLFNLLGKEIYRRDENLTAGLNQLQFAASTLGFKHTGAYFLVLDADDHSLMKKIIYLK